ncbi:MAG TPA: hypothetical protein DEB06_08585 [Phycisphaerales bacterium]|nr:hypothetical protein [Phycisphaerales bacterium]
MTPDIVEALVRTIALKDQSTAAHTWRVVLYTRALAESLGVEKDVIARLSVAAALHDVGKIDIPDEILRKPGKLTDEEFGVIKSHTTLGHERLVRMGEDDPILLNLVRWHHERIDGKGYPDGLAGDRIPLGPRLFSVIDSFDAMTSVRPYRTAVGAEAARRAIEELRAGAGSRYSPDAVEIFASLFESGGLDWVLHYFNDEVPVPDIKSVTGSEQMERLRG